MTDHPSPPPETVVVHVLVGVDERGVTDEMSTATPWEDLQQTLDEVREAFRWQAITILRPEDHERFLGGSDVLPPATTYDA